MEIEHENEHELTDALDGVSDEMPDEASEDAFEDDASLFDEDLSDDSDGEADDEDVPFEYDDEGNVIIPGDEDAEGDEGGAADETDASDAADADAGDASDAGTADGGGEASAESAPATDAKDAEIATLRAQLAQRDALLAARDSQIRDTLKSLGADDGDAVAGLERLAAEAQELTLEEYRERRAEQEQAERALRLLKQQRFDEKARADLAAVQSAYPETKAYGSVFDLPNAKRFGELRDLGLKPEEAYIAANPQAVMNRVADATRQQARNISGTKDHLRTAVPKGSKDTSLKISKREMSEYRELFPDLSDKEIVALHKQTMRK